MVTQNERGAMKELEGEALASAVLALRGFSPDGLSRSPHEGIVNEVWMTASHVVRINKDPELIEDCFTEAVAAPAAWKAGALTPEPLFFSSGDNLTARPYSIFARARGVNLASAPPLSDPEGFFRSLAREMRVFHQMILTVSDPDERLDPAWLVTVDDIRDKAVHPACLAFTSRANDLAEALDGPQWPGFAFCHQDLHPENILAEGGLLTAILDWGDAGWGDPACDLRFIPARHMKAAWEAYGADLDLKRRTCLHLIDQFLYSLIEERSYGPNGDSTWDEVSSLCQEVSRELA